jgi:hypothetical protein
MPPALSSNHEEAKDGGRSKSRQLGLLTSISIDWSDAND